MKAKRSIYNLIFGLGSQLISIAIGIIIPRLFLVNFGSEVNGLISSINQILVYLVLLEAGVGMASLQALYHPISQKDKAGINSILSATSNYYKKTGIYYFIAVMSLAIIYPLIVQTNLSKTTVSIIIIITGMSGVINYVFQAKYKLLLSAEGKNYINISITTIGNTLISISKIILLLLGYNIIIIQLSYFIISILQTIILQLYIRKNYKWLNLGVEPNFNAISQKGSVLVHEIAYLIFLNTDVIILSIFCDLKVVSVYVIYIMLFNMIETAINSIGGSLTFALGQTYHENKQRFLRFYEAYELYFTALTFSLYTVAYILILPFMKLYTEGITDINYIDLGLSTLFVIVKLLSSARIPFFNTINIAGDFKKTQNGAIIEAIINLVCSLIFVNIFGIYGVLMGTIVAMLYRMIYVANYVNKNILNRNSWINIKRLSLFTILFLILIVFNNSLEYNLNSYIRIILWAMCLSAIILPTYFIVASLFERDIFKFINVYLKNYLNKLQQKYQRSS
jgi:O-antigen/teichoic acid export membrane protein